MTLDVSVTRSTRDQGRIDVQWSAGSAAYFSSSARAYVVTCAVDNSLDEWKNREWMAVINNGSTTTIQLDAAGLEQSDNGSAIIQGCSKVVTRRNDTAHRIDNHSRACRWTKQQSPSTIAISHSAGPRYWLRFISRVLGRLVPEIFVSFFTSLCEYI